MIVMQREYIIKISYVLHKVKTNFKLCIGLIILLSLFALGLISIYIPPRYRNWYSLPKDMPPQLGSDPAYWLGTSSNGRSVLYSLMRAILNSLIIGFITALVASHIGLFLGMISGIRGGLIDRIISFLADAFIAIPPLPLHIVVVIALKEYISLPLLGLLFVIPSSWAWPARQVRAVVLSLREREYVLTSLLSGNNVLQIVIGEMMPHLIGWHVANFINTVLFAIGSEMGLAILGLSLLREDTLGVIVYWIIYFGALYRGVWWWTLAPVVTTIVLFASLYLISSGIQELSTK